MLCTTLLAWGQDSTQAVHSAHKASIYSALLPGSGQVYNKKYWKVPIVYAALGSTVYFAYDNNQQYQQYRDAYLLRKEGETDTYINVYSDSQLITIMEYYERNRDLSYILSAVVYLLNIVDASVDAHLFDFDVSDNLSFRGVPQITTVELGYTPTLSLQMNF